MIQFNLYLLNACLYCLQVQFGKSTNIFSNYALQNNISMYLYIYKVLPYQISLVAQMVKHLPAMRETQVQFLGQEVPLGKEMATHSSILAWRVPWTEAPGGLQSMVLQKQDMTWCYFWHNNQCDSTCCILLALQIV